MTGGQHKDCIVNIYNNYCLEDKLQLKKVIQTENVCMNYNLSSTSCDNRFLSLCQKLFQILHVDKKA